jgi:hypothetical protein
MAMLAQQMAMLSNHLVMLPHQMAMLTKHMVMLPQNDFNKFGLSI